MRNAFKKRFYASIILFIFMGIFMNNYGTVYQVEQTDLVLHWDKILISYNKYIDFPSQENAEELLASLPIDAPDKRIGDAEVVLKEIFSAESYVILAQEAHSGDRIAVEIYFRMLNITDGLYAENIESGLGFIVRNHPRLFLEMLMKYKHNRRLRSGGYPVSFIGIGHNMHARAAIHILQKRIDAIRSVKDLKYTDLKIDCIQQLRDAMKLRAQLVDKQ